MSMDLGGKGGVKSDINVTPLVDVMLVLLIIMMIIAPMLQKGVDVKLPTASNTVDKPETQDQTVVAVTADGRVYRPDTPDATHVPMFHQLEGLAIDEDITLADLQGVLLAVARQMFGEHTEVRLRPGYFPFTEPSVEVDVSCFRCGGTGYEGASRCFTCKGEAWIEILGSGMVDPNVLDYVSDNGYDKERVQGFAFGMGIERIASVVHEVPDLRMLYENDARLLEQFGA